MRAEKGRSERFWQYPFHSPMRSCIAGVFFGAVALGACKPARTELSQQNTTAAISPEQKAVRDGILETLAKTDVPGGLIDLETEFPKEKAEIEKAMSLSLDRIDKEMQVDLLAKRDVHAKAHGCVKGSLKISDSIPADFAHGIFQKSGTFEAWMRFSNAGFSSGTADDRLPDARGIALKVLDVGDVHSPLVKTDDKSGGTGNALDFLFANAPFYTADNIQEYNTQLENPGILAKSRVGLLAKIVFHPVFDPLTETYFSVAAFRLGESAVKYRVAPCKGQKSALQLLPGRNYMRDAMVQHLSEGDGCFDFQAQMYVNPETTPVERGTVVWKEKDAPFVTLATLAVPKQNFLEDQQKKFCENISYQPWRIPKEMRPLGNLNRARWFVYQATSQYRHRLNKIQ